MKNRKPKQVIVLRKDLKMRRGKEIAQGSHASMKVLLDQMSIEFIDEKLVLRGEWGQDSQTAQWLLGQFTKVALYVESEEQLLALKAQATARGIPSTLITDAGLTEFNGVSTNTCIAIGPDDSVRIDEITGGLKLA